VRRALASALGLLLSAVTAGCTAAHSVQPAPLRVGVMLPLSGVDAEPAGEELNGIELAVDWVNHHGGVAGRQVRLVVRDVHTVADAAPAAAWLRAAGSPVVLGTYASWLSMPASAAVAREHLVYWETGAVADRLTRDASPLVFRVGAAGSTLGEHSAAFTATELSPRLHKLPSQTRVAIVEEDDPYGNSVANGVAGQARRSGLDLVARVRYDAGHPDWDRVFSTVRTAHPDVLFLSSYIDDGVAFRRQMLARHVHLGALIGTTMAECGPEFGALLGADAIGVFASDRPTRGFNAQALNATGRRAYAIVSRDYPDRYGLQPAEEAISGFSSAWALLVDVLPHATALTPAVIAAAARGVDIATGSLPNGAGLHFGSGVNGGQNERAASVIWQWQGVRKSVTVWPRVFATGRVEMVPLPR
jgi:branched-chain amino acid transport system substrate-binding protein